MLSQKTVASPGQVPSAQTLPASGHWDRVSQEGLEGGEDLARLELQNQISGTWQAREEK